MGETWILPLLLGLSVGFQFAAAGLAFRLIGITGRRWAWIAIATAIILMAVRRSITLYRLVSGDAPDLQAELVALFISILMVTGLALIAPLFRSIRDSEEALRQSEERLRLTLNAVCSGGWDWNVQTGEFYFSDRCAESLGYTSAEIEPHIRFWESLIHPDDLPTVKSTLQEHLDGLTPYYECENRLRTGSGDYCWNLDQGKVVARDAHGKPLRMVGTHTNITERKRAENARIAALQRTQRHQSTILELATNRSVSEEGFTEASRQITASACNALDVDRVGIWLLNQDQSELHCVDLFERTDSSHSGGETLLADEYPRYFEALRTGRVIDAEDARADPRTSEFSEGYLTPHDIHAMLDATIRVSGEVVGVVCHEHRKTTRNWTADESAFAGEIADQAAQVLINSQRKQAEKSAHDSEKRLRQVIDLLPEMVFAKDINGRFLLVNKTVADAYKTSVNKLTGKLHVEVHPDIEEVDRFLKDDREVIESRQPKLIDEQTFLDKDGNRRLIQTTRIPFKVVDSMLPAVLEVSVDISDRKQAAEAVRKAHDELEERVTQRTSELNQTRRHLELILNSAGEGIYGLDLEGNTTFINPAAARMIGWEPEELIGKNQHAVLHHTRPDGTPYPDVDCPIYAAIKDGIVHHVTDEVFWRKDGSSFPVEYTSTPIREEGALVGAVVVFEDVTDDMQAGHALRESEGRLRGILDTAADAIITIDERASVQSFNASAERIFGYQAGEIIGRNVSLLMPAPYEIEHDEYIARYLQSGEKRIIGIGREVVGRRKDRSTFPMHLAVSEVLLGEKRLFTGIVRDITELKNVEAALRRSNEELEAFAHSVSHDLKAPLRAVEGFTEAVCEDYGEKLDATARHFFSRITEGVVQMGELIDDLLEHARLGRHAERFADIDLNELVGGICEKLSAEIRDSGADIHTDGTLPTVVGHRRTLELAIQNLISNALKFVRPGTTPQIIVSGSSNDIEHRISISDNGIGIEAKYHDAIFGIFERLHTRDEYPGTGIGLAIVSKAAAIHQGRIEVESSLEKGSAFHFCIPRHLENPGG